MLQRVLAPVGAVAMLLLLAAWALSSPQGSSPDDDFHLSSIWCAAGVQEDQCQWVGPPKPDGVNEVHIPKNVGRSMCYQFDAGTSGSCTQELNDDWVRVRSNVWLYPTGFYRTMELFVSENVEHSVLRMRLANAGLMAGLAGLALFLAPPTLRRAAGLSWLATLVPLGTFFIPSTNPSSWTFIGLSTYWVFLLAFLTRPPGKRRWVAAALSVFCATLVLSSRTDGAAYLCATTVAVVVLTSSRPKDLLKPILVLPAALTLVALVVFATSQTSGVVVNGMGDGNDTDPRRQGLRLLVNNVMVFPHLADGMFGEAWGLGWLDTLMPPGVGVAGCAVAFALAIVSAGAYWRTKSLAVLMLGVALVAMPLLVLQESNAFIGEAVQPRYILPLAMVLIGLMLYTREDRPDRSWHLGLPAISAIVLVAAASNALALRTNLQRYLTGIDVPVLNLNAHVEWWWKGFGVTPMWVWIIGSVAGLLVFAAIGAVTHEVKERQ